MSETEKGEEKRREESRRRRMKKGMDKEQAYSDYGDSR